jgi:hypothetical protein
VCQFHIQKGVSTLLKKNPKGKWDLGLPSLSLATTKSEAGKDLKIINNTFIKEKWTHSIFMEKLENYLKTHQQFLNEMSETNPTIHKHERLRKAINKYNLNHKYMFTFQAKEDQIREKLGQLFTAQILARFNKSRKNKNQIFANTANDIDGGLFSPLKNLLGNHKGLNKQM